MKFLLLSLLMISTAGFAKTYDFSDRFGIGGGGGYTFPVTGNDFDDFAKNEVMWGLHARYNFTAEDGLMLNYSVYEFENTPIGARVMDLMWIRRINEGDKFTPMIGLGAGAADMHSIRPFNDSLKFASRARAGFEYAFTDDLVGSVFGDFQFIGKMPFNSEDEDTKDESFPGREIFAVVPQIALTYYFGPDREIPKKDKPAPAATPVATDPSLLDDDKDGIVNTVDKCPGTPPGKTVNSYGCLPKEKVSMRLQVLFPTGQYALGEEASPHLDDLARFMKEHPETKLEIQGHTDSTGSDKKNEKLSQMRANAIRAYLIEKDGVEPERILAKGYGDAVPIADNATKEGRSENRRVIGIITQ